MPTLAANRAKAATYCPAGLHLPDDLKTALDYATVCVAGAAGSRKVLDPDGFLLPRPLAETCLKDRIPRGLDLAGLCGWLQAHARIPADLIAACRSMEQEREISLFLGASGQPTSFSCWHEAALSCRPDHRLAVDALQRILVGCRAEAQVALQLRAAKPASATEPPRPPKPTEKYCLPHKRVMRWKGEVDARPQLCKLLAVLLRASKWPVDFETVETAVWGDGALVRTASVQKRLSELGDKLETIKFPWVYRTEDCLIHRDGTGDTKGR